MKSISVILLAATIIACGEYSQGSEINSPSNTLPNFRAITFRNDFPFPSKFEADLVIAIYDSNGNGYIDSFGGDPSATFPYQLTTLSRTIGSKIGSPFNVIPTANEQARFDVGFKGKVIIYAEQILNNWTYFIWFALPDPEKPDPANPWGLDYGIGAFDGNNVLTAREAYHATFVQDYYTRNGTSFRVEHSPMAFYQGTPSTSLAAPNSIGILSTNQPSINDSGCNPQPWEYIIAGQLHPAYYDHNYFIGVKDIVIDVPLIREEAWDGVSLYKTKKNWGRSICSLGEPTSIQQPSYFFAEPIDALPGKFGYVAGAWRVEQHPRMLGDVNGDGRADIVGFGNGGVSVALGRADGKFAEPTDALPGKFGYVAGAWRVEQHPRMLGDVNGDGRADIVGFGNDGVVVAP